MHQKRTKKKFLLTTWRMALPTKRTICLFFSEHHLSRKERHLYLLPCQMNQKRTTKIVPFDYMKNGSHPQTRAIFFVLFWMSSLLEKNVICTFCLAKCIRKWQQKIVPFDYMKNGSLHKKSNFFSFLNVVFVEKKVICTFCLAKCIRKGKTKFLLTTWRMALPTKRTIFLFFSEHHLSRKERHVYFLPCQMHQKRTIKNCSFWLHEEWLSPQKEQFFCSFLNVVLLEKKVICTFCLAKCIRKGQQKLFLLTTWRMALSTKRAIFLFLS